MKMLCKYRNKRGGTVLLLCIASQSLSVAVFSQESAVPPELIRYADIVLYNGQVLTADADENFTTAQSVAVVVGIRRHRQQGFRS